MQEADQGVERVGAAVMSGPVQSFEEPEEAAPLKHSAKELFPTGDPPPNPGTMSQLHL